MLLVGRSALVLSRPSLNALASGRLYAVTLTPGPRLRRRNVSAPSYAAAAAADTPEPQQQPQQSQTPMMQQFAEFKRQNPGHLLLFRVGSFFEMFGDDARAAADCLGITLTAKNGTAMCGFPHFALDSYMARLIIGGGYLVAVCEQTETPAEARARGATTLRREVRRIVTPGTLTEDSLLHPKAANYLLAIAAAPTVHAQAVARAATRMSSASDARVAADSEARVGLACIDVSTGEMRVSEVAFAQLDDEISRLQPREILLAETDEGGDGGHAGSHSAHSALVAHVVASARARGVTLTRIRSLGASVEGTGTGSGAAARESDEDLGRRALAVLQSQSSPVHSPVSVPPSISPLPPSLPATASACHVATSLLARFLRRTMRVHLASASGREVYIHAIDNMGASLDDHGGHSDSEPLSAAAKSSSNHRAARKPAARQPSAAATATARPLARLHVQLHVDAPFAASPSASSSSIPNVDFKSPTSSGASALNSPASPSASSWRLSRPMRIDAAARRTLELSQPLNGRRENSHLHQRVHLHAPLHRVGAADDTTTAASPSASSLSPPTAVSDSTESLSTSKSKPASSWGAGANSSSSANVNTTSHTLLGCLDRCVTAAGSRLLAAHLAAPLTDCRAINERVRFLRVS
jgi:hypothetical protein